MLAENQNSIDFCKQADHIGVLQNDVYHLSVVLKQVLNNLQIHIGQIKSSAQLLRKGISHWKQRKGRQRFECRKGIWHSSPIKIISNMVHLNYAEHGNGYDKHLQNSKPIEVLIQAQILEVSIFVKTFELLYLVTQFL